ncbi:type II toxin-antitoxin system VapC family toxin [Zavarzinia compransoris]|uniref:type II toxin-antitoxin system VapC family toxin n=1 Tax=Zavarzinia marina TaxID=2911065 RepID=UPI001F2E2859|nr:type II toxin-antitoxin system VapC family toxin [Zavarzinia marina]MCF4165464.1 type II toxin-antitoxin system VapC family toxin [Zavarzinia marina]
MTGFLLDTNLVSETARPAPAPEVREFLEQSRDTWLSVVTIHELTFGIRRHPSPRRRAELDDFMSSLLAEYGDRIIPVDREEAEAAAAMRAAAAAVGRTCHLADALIAGTAKVHSLTLATRNTGDFEALGIALHNPWQA